MLCAIWCTAAVGKLAFPQLISASPSSDGAASLTVIACLELLLGVSAALAAVLGRKVILHYIAMISMVLFTAFGLGHLIAADLRHSCSCIGSLLGPRGTMFLIGCGIFASLVAARVTTAENCKVPEVQA
jgi:hypothetical protein